MTLEAYRQTLNDPAPPPVPDLLKALWHDAKGDWHRAHEVAQAIESAEGAWVHAYLHRKEGDAGNARYWYRRAGRPEASGPLEEEWERLVTSFLGAT